MVETTALGAAIAVSRPFPSWNRPILTEIYLCHACSCQEILRVETARQAGLATGVWSGPADPRLAALTRVERSFTPCVIDYHALPAAGRYAYDVAGCCATAAANDEVPLTRAPPHTHCNPLMDVFDRWEHAVARARSIDPEARDARLAKWKQAVERCMGWADL
eukprot:COSAG01_NODE_9251_length_2504_cov_2.227027_4_plen_163_part_00